MLLERGTPYLTIDIEGAETRLRVDTGSNISILKPGVASSDIMVIPLKTFGVNGETLDIRGRESVTSELGGREFNHTFLVCQLPTDAAGLLGADFLEEADAIISFESSELMNPHRNREPRTRDDASEERAALTVFTEGKEELIPNPFRSRRCKGTNRPQPTPLVKNPHNGDDRGL